MAEEPRDYLNELVQVVARLRGPGGCPWDREQTHLTLLSCLLDETYEFFEAAESLGARPWTVFTRIVLPLTKSGIIAGVALSLGLSMSELGITLLLYGPSWYTLAVQIYIESQWGFIGVAAAMGTVLIVIASAAVLIVHRLGVEVPSVEVRV